MMLRRSPLEGILLHFEKLKGGVKVSYQWCNDSFQFAFIGSKYVSLDSFTVASFVQFDMQHRGVGM